MTTRQWCFPEDLSAGICLKLDFKKKRVYVPFSTTETLHGVFSVEIPWGKTLPWFQTRLKNRMALYLLFVQFLYPGKKVPGGKSAGAI